MIIFVVGYKCSKSTIKFTLLWCKFLIFWPDVKNIPLYSLIISNNPCLNESFGFIYSTVTVPNEVYNPIWPFRYENGNT